MNVAAVATVLGAILSGLLFAARSAADGKITVDRSASGPFSLVDHRGRATSGEDFRGKFLLVFFCYTFCPDVYPPVSAPGLIQRTIESNH